MRVHIGGILSQVHVLDMTHHFVGLSLGIISSTKSILEINHSSGKD